MNNIVEISHATKRFGGLIANDDISFNVEANKILGIIGPNGAGKTTLFNSISGAHSLTSGTITYKGVDITKKPAHSVCKLGVGRTFQIPQAFNELTVLENVLVGGLCRHGSMQKAAKVAEKSIEICGLSQHINAVVGQLNVIQKKRIEIARALATEPQLILLDETMAGLTITERKGAIDLIKDINAMGITILMIEHVMDVVMAVSDRVVVINEGKLLMEGSPDEVTSDERVIRAYLGGDE